MHVVCEQGPPVLTWERRPVGHEDQLVGNGFGSGVVVHVLSEDRSTEPPNGGQRHCWPHLPSPPSPPSPRAVPLLQTTWGFTSGNPDWEMARP